MARLFPRAFALFLIATGVARADVAPLITMTATPLFGATATSLFGETVGTTASSTGSLFTGTQSGYFAPLPARARAEPDIPRALGSQSPIAQLLNLIARVEAGRDGYDAVQHGARIRTPRPPTQMTLGDIYAWIEATPGQPHAIGRYQFIPPPCAVWRRSVAWVPKRPSRRRSKTPSR